LSRANGLVGRGLLSDVLPPEGGMGADELRAHGDASPAEASLRLVDHRAEEVAHERPLRTARETATAAGRRPRPRSSAPATTRPTSRLRSATPRSWVEMGRCRAGTRPSSTDQPATSPTRNATIASQLTSP